MPYNILKKKKFLESKWEESTHLKHDHNSKWQNQHLASQQGHVEKRAAGRQVQKQSNQPTRKTQGQENNLKSQTIWEGTQCNFPKALWGGEGMRSSTDTAHAHEMKVSNASRSLKQTANKLCAHFLNTNPGSHKSMRQFLNNQDRLPKRCMWILKCTCEMYVNSKNCYQTSHLQEFTSHSCFARKHQEVKCSKWEEVKWTNACPQRKAKGALRMRLCAELGKQPAQITIGWTGLHGLQRQKDKTGWHVRVCLCACMRVSILEELREEQLTKRGKSRVRHPAIVNFRIIKAPCRKRETVLSEGSNCALLEGHMSKNMYVGSTNWSSSVKRCGRELEKWLSG